MYENKDVKENGEMCARGENQCRRIGSGCSEGDSAPHWSVQKEKVDN